MKILSKEGALKFDVSEIRLAVEDQLLISEASLHGRDRIDSQAAHTFRYFAKSHFPGGREISSGPPHRAADNYQIRILLVYPNSIILNWKTLFDLSLTVIFVKKTWFHKTTWFIIFAFEIMEESRNSLQIK